MEKIIEISKVVKNFGKKKVLKELNLDIYKKDKIAILGGNGEGKSTLIDLISQITKPTSGEIKINIDQDVKKEIGIQFQQGEWPSGINAQDMIILYRSIFPKFTSEWEKQLLEIFEIDEFIKRPLNKLSGGQKQRFNSMIALMNQPEIIILDELTTGLDLKLQIKIMNFIKKVCDENNKTLIIVSHSPEEVELLCQRVAIVYQGKIILDKTIAEVKKEYNGVRNLMNKHFEGEI
ncbi:ABC transporter ATP-binding protein [Spiroplasma culicicola]|uniref:ABC transporter ATP-binding protein n=1 Tax=Spiroplasma culicicola AES-1 TaxID=1276246 RepID=W6A750_9MOLU|nr:ABC transporter ATP-binding protein [Spiroplasma culicicola]AHI52968.1 ABC transporter ATP-binding protein [Spiroplasma culicicola AES-1]